MNQITNELRTYFKKKHKVDVKPAELKNHMTLFINASIVRPRYDSQTKEKLITEPKEYKTEFKVDDKFINKLVKSPIIQDVLDWVAAKQHAAEMAELRKKNKEIVKANPRRIEKFSDANEKNQRSKCILFLTEGDSASKAIQSARDTRWMGSYPLKGKPVNVNGTDVKKLIANKEFNNIMTIMGLQLGVKVKSPEELYFGKIGYMTDADVDGSHIVGLLINMLYHFWPELFEMGVVYRFRTPLLKVWPTGQKKAIEFFTEAEFQEWKAKNLDTKFKSRYFKGLGTSKTEDFKGYLSDLDRYLIPLVIEDREDKDAIDLAFNKDRADDRKEWLALRKGESNE
jgi:DNA topoisomerase-2